MAFDFSSGSWADHIANVTEQAEYQTCTIRINWAADVLDAYDYRTNETYKVSKALSTLAASEDDAALVAALNLPDGTLVIRQNTGAPAGVAGDVWVRKVDLTYVVFVYDGGWSIVPVDSEVYEGQARFIPIRAGVWQGGEAQLNATTIRAVRFQVPFADLPDRVHSGAIITITDAPFNASLIGRTAKVTDDLQGATTASRTINAMMDADSEDS